MELLSKSFSQMALSLHEGSEYILEFATYVSHELRTPLTAIQGASELLLEHYEEMSPDKRRRFIENMLYDADRLKLLVARLLELAKVENLTPSKETANLSDILSKLYANTLPKDWSLRSNLNPTTNSRSQQIFSKRRFLI